MKVYVVTNLWVNDCEIYNGADVFATREAAVEFFNKSIENEINFWREDLNYDLPADAGKQGFSCYDIVWHEGADTDTIVEIDANNPQLYPDITIDRTPTSFCINRTDNMMWAEYQLEEKEMK